MCESDLDAELDVLTPENRMRSGQVDDFRLFDLRHDALVIRERNTAHGVRWSFENTYWADFNTGFVWASVQHFSPRQDPMQIQITKPAGPPASG